MEKCGCVVSFDPAEVARLAYAVQGVFSIQFCPLHKAAPELLSLLKRCSPFMRVKEAQILQAEINAAIRSAESVKEEVSG